LIRLSFFLILFFFTLNTLLSINAQTNSTIILENEALKKSSSEKPIVEVSIEGTPNTDKIRGGDGNDEINGADGNDIIYGKEGDDELEGGKGDDILYGDDGDDTINGGTGNDKLVGGFGTDELKGGSGTDLFVCDEDDKVIDFNSVDNDRSEGSCEIIDEALPSDSNENANNNDDFNNGDFGEDDDDDDDDISSLRPIF
jgi:Ca2+-binding RTX toxin-like protein